MKKLSLSFLLLTTCLLYGQRHLQGTFGAGLDAGIAHLGGGYGFGTYVAPTFTYNLTDKLYLKGELMYERSNQTLPQSEIKVNSYYLNASTFYNLFNVKETIFVNAGAGLQGTFADIKDSNDGVGTYTSKRLDFGILAGIESEIFISDRLVLLFNFKQVYQPLDNHGKWIPFTGGGVKINF